MSYPPPPGLKAAPPQPSTSSSTLPPRPPPPANPQAFALGNGRGSASSTASGAKASTGFGAFTAFQPRAVASSSNAQAFRANSSYAAGPTPASSHYAAAPASYSAQAQHFSQAPSPAGAGAAGNGSYYAQAAGSYDSSYANPTPPQIRNPFAVPGQLGGFGRGGGAGGGMGGNMGGNYAAHAPADPDLEAQIAQWQSAYTPRDDAGSRGGNRTGGGSGGGNYNQGSAAATGANTGPLGPRSGGIANVGGAAGFHNNNNNNNNNNGSSSSIGPSNDATLSANDMATAASADTAVASVVTGADGKQKTVVRSGGGQTWQDSSLLEWDPAHFRLFVGNLAGEVTDESLLKAFLKYPSVHKARVIRDKRTTKSKGYGFVSFGDGDDYFQAAKEMQGKYIGSHPVLLRKSTTEIKPTAPHNKKKMLGKGGKGSVGAGKGGSGNGAAAGGAGAGAGAGAGQGYGAGTGAGIQKKHAKTKGGLKILG